MKIVILDYMTLGNDLDVSGAEKYGIVIKYEKTAPDEVAERIHDADAIIVNKIKLTADVLKNAKKLKIICEAATGYDNIDIEYCTKNGIAVTNTPAYSSNNVAQLTASMALSLITHLSEYSNYVNSGEYSQSGNANRLIPVYHEIAGLTWGIIGYGNIGKSVGRIATALGCDVIVNKRTPEKDVTCVDIDTLLSKSDIISIHCPLTNDTRGMIDGCAISKMKKNAIIINVARGAIWDENEIANAVLNGKIGGVGCDVYSVEPFSNTHPFYALLGVKNVILTPHMAWGSFEARKRCFNMILSNLDAFINGEKKNRIC